MAGLGYWTKNVLCLVRFGRHFLLRALCQFVMIGVTFLLGITNVIPNVAANQSTQLDPKRLKVASVSAMVTDAKTGKTAFHKNADLVVPIASLTKVMTAMVVLDSGLPLNERLTITKNRHRAGKNAYSRIRLGSTLKRKDLLKLALMSSENRAAAVLAHSVPGGLSEFVRQMNRKAAELKMTQTLFVDSTGLSTDNVSTAKDLTRMVRAALQYPLIREYSTTKQYTANFSDPKYRLAFGNTNVLVHRDAWDIQLSKTGYLNEAGRCLVLGVNIDATPLIVVLLDSFGKRTPIGDVGRIKRWYKTGQGGKVAGSAQTYEKQKLRERLLNVRAMP